MSALKFQKWGTFLSLVNGECEFLAAVYPPHTTCPVFGDYEISRTVLVATNDKDRTVSSFYSGSFYFELNEMKSSHHYKLKKKMLLFFNINRRVDETKNTVSECVAKQKISRLHYVTRGGEGSRVCFSI